MKSERKSVNLKISWVKLSNLRNRKKREKNADKCPQSRRTVWQHQAYQHTHNGRARGEEIGKRLERIFEETLVGKFSNLIKEIDLDIQEAQQTLR